MMYDLSNSLELKSFKLRVKKLEESKSMVELTEKRARSLNQNAYCHLAISYFALQIGLPTQEVKEVYFKNYCNHELFVRKRYDKILNVEREYLRSTTELTKEEMSVAIDRFLKFASEQGVYIAPSDEYIAILHMQHEVQRNQKYLGV